MITVISALPEAEHSEQWAKNAWGLIYWLSSGHQPMGKAIAEKIKQDLLQLLNLLWIIF